MRVQVLLSAMFQQDFSLIEKSHIKTDAIIVNQCNEDSIFSLKHEGNSVIWVNSKNRGLAKSRNLALSMATADICLLCDEDVVYYEDYTNIIEKAFSEVENADVLIFDIDEVGTLKPRKHGSKIKKNPWYKTYGSVHVAFKRAAITENKIWFNEFFGAGSGMYAMAEDALLFREFVKHKLHVYYYPAVISKVSFEQSSWFNGFDEKYFYDVGAYLACAYGSLAYVFMFYYPLRVLKKSPISTKNMLKLMVNGIDGYKKRLSYTQYCKYSKMED